MIQQDLEPPAIRGPASGSPPPRGAPRWSTTEDQATPMAENAVTRFLGGSPIAVAVRLAVVSLIVGALLMWLDIRPIDVIHGVERFFQRLWNMGFEAFRDIIQYLIAGAVIVLPVWFVMRLLSMRGR
ncbi:MAG: hypothetical protein JWM36_515 [Hyphomicrobiales bacterium]|nr:hypothetical protein [Hyphomicrobiales bacterium]